MLRDAFLHQKEAPVRISSLIAVFTSTIHLGPASSAKEQLLQAHPIIFHGTLLLQVLRDSYEYHGLNDLFFFCITALAVTLVS
jgi:hypothetical protein